MRPEDYGTMVLRYVIRYALVKESRKRKGCSLLPPICLDRKLGFTQGNLSPDGNLSARYAAR